MPLPYEFILNRDLLVQLYPNFVEGATPFFTLNWSKYAEFLTFRGGLDLVTGGLWLTDIAHHHLAIAILFLIAGHMYKTNWGIGHGLKDILEAHKGPFTGSLTIVVAHHIYSMPPYPYLATDYGTQLSLFTHHMWIGRFLIVGAAAHASIFMFSFVSDKANLGFHFPCDGPGRGGTCQLSAWDHVFLGLFWMYNSISVVIFHFSWKMQSDVWGSDPLHVRPIGHAIWDLYFGQPAVEAFTRGGDLGPVNIAYSGVYQWWYTIGLRTNQDLYTDALFLLFLSAISLIAGLFGLSSLAWTGHLVHVAIPASRGKFIFERSLSRKDNLLISNLELMDHSKFSNALVKMPTMIELPAEYEVQKGRNLSDLSPYYGRRKTNDSGASLLQRRRGELKIKEVVLDVVFPETNQASFDLPEAEAESVAGIRGILLNRRNIPIMSMPIESMLLAMNSNFLVFSVSSNDMMGQSFASLVPMVAAAESAIGLAIFVITFQGQGLSRWATHLIRQSFLILKPLPIQLLKDRDQAF
ncbi:Photosystem I chlorophyll a apoprotein A1 [Capsicum chinense]|nr:Photosystem I chlorophyll a apoprotein A1 [Capsicum chinense]